MSTNAIPVTPMMNRYTRLRELRGIRVDGKLIDGLLDQHLAEARLANEPDEISRIVSDFEESVELAEAFFVEDNVQDEPFFGSPRKPLVHEPGTSSTSQIGALFQHYPGATWDVPERPELGFRFLERELVVTQARGFRFEDGRVSSNGPRIDLLLASADGLPIVGEVKVAGDSSPFLALIQALAAAAYLTPPLQRGRLLHHSPAGALSGDDTRIDVYLIAVSELVRSKPRRAILDETKGLSEKLAPKLGKYVRRIAGVDLSYDPELGLRGRRVEPRFSFEATA